MKKIHPQKNFVALTLAAVLVAGLISPLTFRVRAEEPKTTAPATTNSVTPSAVSPTASTSALHKKLTGAELYSIHCNRCHPERFPTERTAAQWKTIMLHMQVRAGIPGKQSRLILQYLQENSGR